MDRVSVDDVESKLAGDGIDYRELSAPLETEHVAINHFRIPPGDELPGGLHAHADQEEVFVVLDGEATFETLDGEVTVGAGEAIRSAPREFQSGKNSGNDDLVVLAMGAPRDSEDVRIPLACPECDNDEMRLDFGREEATLVCPACRAERVPRGCPECGTDDVRVTLDETDQTTIGCPECGAEVDGSPYVE